nr:MAG TPA: hypothetical protein [Caudoviricetes sp.]
MKYRLELKQSQAGKKRKAKNTDRFRFSQQHTPVKTGKG